MNVFFLIEVRLWHILIYLNYDPRAALMANRVGKRLITAVPPTPPGIRFRTAAVSINQRSLVLKIVALVGQTILRSWLG